MESCTCLLIGAWCNIIVRNVSNVVYLFKMMEFHCVPFVLDSMLQQFQQSHLDLPMKIWHAKCTWSSGVYSAQPTIVLVLCQLLPVHTGHTYLCATPQLALGQYRKINTVTKEVVMNAFLYTVTRAKGLRWNHKPHMTNLAWASLRDRAGLTLSGHYQDLI